MMIHEKGLFAYSLLGIVLKMGMISPDNVKDPLEELRNYEACSQGG